MEFVETDKFCQSCVNAPVLVSTCPTVPELLINDKSPPISTSTKLESALAKKLPSTLTTELQSILASNVEELFTLNVPGTMILDVHSATVPVVSV